VALRIVRAEGEATAVRPLRLWYSGRHSEALEALVGVSDSEQFDELGQLVELALAHDLQHATRIGEALLTWQDADAAYRQLKRTCERLIDDLKPLGAAAWMASAVALVEISLPWLARRPHEPVILNYVGVALHGLNEPALAVRLFEAVVRLDPTTENIRGNISTARKRLKHPVRVPLRTSLAVAVRGLRPSIERIAARARMRPDAGEVSLCMIVRDEEEMLAACLESCREAVSEMIVVDTGSTDRSVEIAESFGARVVHFAWTGNFSDARNAGIDQATGDWILWLDADEQLEPGDGSRLAELTREPWREAHWFVETNYTGQHEGGTASQHLALRLFRNRPGYRFTLAIHEQIRNSMPYDLTERFGPPSLRIRHYGYLKQRIDDRGKHARNLELLHGELETNPRSSFTHFNIATEYVGLDDLPSARRHYEQGLELLRQEHAWWELGYAAILVSRLCGVRRLLSDLDGSDELALELLGHFPAFTDLVFERGLVAQDRGDPDGAAELFERCLRMGDAPPRYAGVVGRGSFLAYGALALLESRRGNRDAAIGWFERSLAAHPEYLGAGLDLAALLLSDPDADPDVVLARLDAFPHEELTWYLFLGTAFYERGHAVHAEQLMRRSLSIGEGHPAARVGLLEALVTQKRYDDVEPESAGLAPGTPAFLAAQRLRMLAATLRGDRANVDAALDALADGGGEGHEVELLRAAAAAILDGTPPPPLSRLSAQRSLELLHALARLGEFTAFERVIPVVEQAIGDRREATILIGEIFLMRGFYQLAADAALRAIELGGQDARTLRLLGKSAVAEGMFEDAIAVLQAALELEPGQDSVETLLAQVRELAATAAAA
jgi:glycosyltransferase involved in cell wall biosynthesis